jgi:ubiquinone/menaquinone biosynthesis C-methylase UbiE
MNHSGWNSKEYKKFDERRAAEYAAIANEVFAPIYPVIACQILERCKVQEGLCLDLGCGPANLAIALAESTALTFLAMDFSPCILGHARENILREGLAQRVIPLAGDVHRLPVADGAASLVVSRGSMRFWRNRPAAFREIKRVLAPGGRGYVGGGLGSSRLAEEIDREMVRRSADWQNKPKPKTRNGNRAEWREIMAKAGISRYETILDDSGSWIYFENDY